MLSFRLSFLFPLVALGLESFVTAQYVPPMQYNQPTQSVQNQQPQQTGQQPMPHTSMQLDPLQQQRLQAQPVKAPLFGTQANVPPPTAQQQPAANQPVLNQQPLNPPYNNQPYPPQQPVRVATAQQPITLYGQRVSTQPPMTTAVIPVREQTPPMGRVPVSQVVPYMLNPVEQQELDEFLIRWEKYSTGVKRYDVDFNLFIYNAAIPGADPSKPYKVAYGYFKYIATPRRFVYVVEGEWQGTKQIKRDGDKNPQIFAEKIIIDERSVAKYDYNSKTVHQVNVPAELIGKGIADSPLPLIFGARADELKRRFSMKVVSQGELLRLFARPLLPEDQQEFKELEILLNKQNLTARGLKQWSTSDKEYNVYDLQSPKVNDRLSFIADDLKSWFAQTVDRDWKYEVTDWVAAPMVPPSAAPAGTQPRVARPQPTVGNEIPLYQVQ